MVFRGLLAKGNLFKNTEHLQLVIGHLLIQISLQINDHTD
ncbi:hypothetical protein N479_26445 [Pseudoalteromonas luteoviolacea S4054]|uniref:Uncharacterized protein n=1 Tax=Pseudoalteromonas luteoviolacea S4054 TaxID=1129367 RepID=A0A0F6AF28_9GAMM|nr:hypothetical protein N479_26445 [Pseudoalteromonas luteoviolacea S4054]